MCFCVGGRRVGISTAGCWCWPPPRHCIGHLLRRVRVVCAAPPRHAVRNASDVPQAVLFVDDETVSKGMVKYATAIPRESIVDVEGTLKVPGEPIVGCSQSQVSLSRGGQSRCCWQSRQGGCRPGAVKGLELLWLRSGC